MSYPKIGQITKYCKNLFLWFSLHRVYSIRHPKALIIQSIAIVVNHLTVLCAIVTGKNLGKPQCVVVLLTYLPNWTYKCMIYCIISSQNTEQQHCIVMEPELKITILCVIGKESEEDRHFRAFINILWLK